MSLKSIAVESVRLNAETTLNLAIALNKLFKQQQELVVAQKSITKQKDRVDAHNNSLTHHAEAEKLWPDFFFMKKPIKSYHWLKRL